MNITIFKMFPDDILNIIWSHIKPSIKYCADKKHFTKFYCYRFSIVNSNYVHNSYIFYIIKNYNYINYLIKNNCLIMIKNLIEYKIKHDKTDYILNNKIKYKNVEYKNFIDFCYFYSKYYKSNDIYNYIISFIKKNNLNYLLKKMYKNNNNKNIKWKI